MQWPVRMRIRESRPSRARGLKLIVAARRSESVSSRPSRARGLKPATNAGKRWAWPVAPLAGAWIETAVSPSDFQPSMGRAPRGRVD